jgi:hypothetical protein
MVFGFVHVIQKYFNFYHFVKGFVIFTLFFWVVVVVVWVVYLLLVGTLW